MIKCVIFDIGDTLINTSEAAEKTARAMPDLKILMSAGYSVNKGLYIKTRKSLKENYRKLSKKERAKPHIYSYLMLKGMGIKLNRELAEKMDLAFIQEQKKHQKPAKNTKKIFEYLKSKNILMSSITNAKNDKGIVILRKFGLTEYFLEILKSCDFGFEKSELKIFNILQKKLKQKGHNIHFNEFLMVGNDAKEDAAAKSLGIKVALLKKNLQEKKALTNFRPDYLIDNLIEIKNIINNLNDN